MTADEVLEAMARGIAHSSDCDGDDGFRACVPEHCVCRSLARAAIRAVTERGGLVVAKVPGNVKILFGPERAEGYAEGWNAALAAVRASAVEVKP